MAITITITQDDLLGLSPQFSQSINRILQWMGEVDSAIGSGGNNLRVVASTAALQAVAAADRADGDVAVLADSGQIMRFSAASSAPEALGPPITVIAPSAGTGRWLAVALPPQASVDATALASSAVTTPKIAASAVTASKLDGTTASATGNPLDLGVVVAGLALIDSTAGNTDLSAAGVDLILIDASYTPGGTVGALSTIQIQTAAGAANITEALDISAASPGEVKRFASIDIADRVIGAAAGLRIVTTGTDVGGTVSLTFVRFAP